MCDQYRPSVAWMRWLPSEPVSATFTVDRSDGGASDGRAPEYILFHPCKYINYIYEGGVLDSKYEQSVEERKSTSGLIS